MLEVLERLVFGSRFRARVLIIYRYSQALLGVDQDNYHFLLPDIHDHQMRRAFRLLPVGARFSFHQHRQPDVVCCPLPGCGAPETERHLSFECDRASQLWEVVGRDWASLLGTMPTWAFVVHISSSPGPRSCALGPDSVRSVWCIFRAIALHQLWTQRNPVAFDNRRPLPLISHVIKLYTTFAAYLRRLCRTEVIDSATLDHIDDALRISASGGVVFDRLPRFLATRSVTSLVPLETIRSVFGHTN